MAAKTNTAADFDNIAFLLDVEPLELHELLYLEFQTISADITESARYPTPYEQFEDFAIEKLSSVVNSKYLPVLQKMLHRNEARKLYFFENELEALSRILFVIEIPGHSQVSLNNLNLHRLPSLLRMTRNLQKLNISNNRLRNISLVADLRDLQVLIANDNEITDIEFLQNNHKLRVVCLNNNRIKSTYDLIETMPALRELELAGNKISDGFAKIILHNTLLEKINLENNPINAPLEILNDVNKLRSHFGITMLGNAKSIENDDELTALNANDLPSAKATFETHQEEQFVSYAIRDIRLRGNPDKNLLDIEKLSGIFYNLIANSDSNGEHFFGLFGRWGRGKTFFWKYILQNNLDRTKYFPIEFHAWKYQDTPGVWAYLYNTLNDEYLGERPKHFLSIGKWIKYFNRLRKLNNERGSFIALWGLLAVALIALCIYFLVGQYQIKAEHITLKTILGLIGVPVSLYTILISVSKYFKTDARKIITRATTNVNFNSQLGFQHEIQQELKHLLITWIPEEKKFTRRIFLFIDDIDRCSENKIIQIVDYIRVLLHDKEIQDRITVLAAIDERILLHAIQDKYRQFIENKDNDATYKELCREYMDKLFLAGLKLGPLTETEKRQIVDGFTGVDTSNTDTTPPAATNGISSAKVADVISKTESEEKEIPDQVIQQANKANVVIPEGEEPPVKVTPIPIASTAHRQFSYEKWEQEFIKDILARNTESTPRSIRVYSYRYLLGKQLVEKSLSEGRPSWVQWYNTKEAKQCFAIKLLHYGFKSDTEHLLSDYRNFISDYNENQLVKECIYGYEISLNQELGSIMFQVLTMIIAY